jgi:hypothetical protein
MILLEAVVVKVQHGVVILRVILAGVRYRIIWTVETEHSAHMAVTVNNVFGNA